MKSLYYAFGLLALTIHSQAQVCKRINTCVSQHQSDYATSYCSSYLSISTATSTVSGSVTTATSTSTVYTATSSVLHPYLYQECGYNPSKEKRATTSHSKPFCLRTFTQSASISKGCECLHLSTPTTTVTAAPSTTTTHTTLSTASTTTYGSFFIQDAVNNYLAVRHGDGSPTTFEDVDSGSSYVLAYSGNNYCQLFIQGFVFATVGSGEVVSALQGELPGPQVHCLIDESTNLLDCTASNAGINKMGPTTSSGEFDWLLVDTGASGSDTFPIFAVPGGSSQ